MAPPERSPERTGPAPQRQVRSISIDMSLPSSLHLPHSALGSIFQDDARLRQLITQTIGFWPVFVLPRLIASPDEILYFVFLDWRFCQKPDFLALEIARLQQS